MPSRAHGGRSPRKIAVRKKVQARNTHEVIYFFQDINFQDINIIEGRDVMIDTVVFDIGNVLAGFDWDAYIRRCLKDEAVIAEVNEAIWGSGLWHEFDRGVMATEDVIAAMMERAPHRKDEIRLLMDHVGETLWRFDHAIPWIESVKAAGRRALFLSNYSRLAMDANPGVLDFLPHLEGGVFSCDVKLLKPDRAIYATLCNKYALTPERCVFIDDLAPNVQGARDFGMNAIRCLSHEQARGELEAMLKDA